MKPFQLQDISMEKVRETTYDLALFTLGNEERCASVTRQISPHMVSNAIIAEREGSSGDLQLAANREILGGSWRRPSLRMTETDGLSLVQAVEEIVQETDTMRPLRVLIDYSAMPPTWYASVLHWFAVTDRLSTIELDFAYSVSMHRDKFPPLMIEQINPLPGYNGTGRIRESTALVVGLGFDHIAVQAALERMPPSVLFVHLSYSPFHPDYRDKARHLNHEVIKRADGVLELPLTSVDTAFSYLARLIFPYRQSKAISFLPMGPKPHILAAILVALRYEGVTCLRVEGQRTISEAVGSLGETVATRILLGRQENGPCPDEAGV